MGSDWLSFGVLEKNFYVGIVMKIFVFFVVCLLVGCVVNVLLCDDSELICVDMWFCSDSYYECYLNYEIGFVEYSECGNDFVFVRM